MDNRNTPNELDEMFPNAKAILHDLKVHNSHFVRLAEDYHQVNRLIHRMETNVEPAADEAMEVERKKRLHLLDQIAKLVEEHKGV